MKHLKTSLPQLLPYLLIVVGVIGLIAAFVITDEKIKLLQDPSYHPACSINPIISCGSVMQSKQSHVFGFPNSFIGLAAFPMVLTVGVAMLAGATFKRWFWLVFNAGFFLGLVFVHWLFFESVYRIHALCPYCMGVWAVTITGFWYLTLYNLQAGALPTPKKLAGLARFVRRHHGDILVAWLLIIVVAILHHFWYYFGRSFGA
ncbi:MAG: rane protein-like protein [Candidatus Saccharibacteria bacterium]|nr:rane protein-like protein [Candidatus Saccharibacteria bacterium]